MKVKDLITKKRTKLDALRAPIAGQLAQRDTHTGAIATVRSACDAEGRDPSEAEATQIREARAAVNAIDVATAAVRASMASVEREIAELEDEQRSDDDATRAAGTGTPTGHRAPAYDEVARVGREERTYTPEKSTRGEASFFADAYGARSGNVAARQRIERNLAEALAEREISERATTTASFAGLVVPQYLVDLAAPVARAGRPFANVVNHQQLPAKGMSLVVPRGTVGASVGVQAAQNTAVQETDQVFTDLTVPVVTIAGGQKVARQALDRGSDGLDEMLYMDLVGAHAVALDQQTLIGSGASGQMLGLLNTAGITQMSAFAAAVTPQTYYSKIAGAVNAVQTLRFMAPNLIVGAPRRWNWLVSAFDAQNRPLVVPRSNGPMNALGVWDEPKDTPAPEPAGELQGLPFVTDASLPLSVGTGPEDQTVVARREDLILWEESNGLPRQLRFDEPLGNQLEVQLVVFSYAAFTAGRYPTAVAIIGGNAAAAGSGTVAPTF